MSRLGGKLGLRFERIREAKPMEDAIVGMLKLGDLSKAEIAEKAGVHPYAVGAFARRHGLVARAHGRSVGKSSQEVVDRRKRLLEAYQSGKTIREIATEEGVTHQAIHQVLSKCKGYEPRSIVRCLVSKCKTCGREFDILNTERTIGLKAGSISRSYCSDDCYRSRRISFPSGEDASPSVLVESDVIEIRRARREGVPLSELADRFGVTVAAVSHAASGRTWKSCKEPTFKGRRGRQWGNR